VFTNHPKNGDLASFNAALCGLWAAGLGLTSEQVAPAAGGPAPASVGPIAPETSSPAPETVSGHLMTQDKNKDKYAELGRIFADAIQEGLRLYGAPGPSPADQPEAGTSEPVVVTGAALGLPGTEHVFADENLQRILDGEQFIDAIPHRFRQQMVDLHITRLVKR